MTTDREALVLAVEVEADSLPKHLRDVARVMRRTTSEPTRLTLAGDMERLAAAVEQSRRPSEVVAAVAALDPYEHSHYYASQVGRLLGMDEAQIDAVRYPGEEVPS